MVYKRAVYVSSASLIPRAQKEHKTSVKDGLLLQHSLFHHDSLWRIGPEGKKCLRRSVALVSQVVSEGSL